MAEITWVKLSVDILENRKIKYLRRLPDGDTVFTFWIGLLAMAGKINDNGRVYLTETLPYSTKMLADEMSIEENTVILALDCFKRLEMVEIDNGIISILSWEEYQNVEGMETIRKQNRLRQARFRERKTKQLPEANVTVTLPVTLCNASDIDIEEDIDKEQEIKSVTVKRFTPPTKDDVESYCKEKNYSVSADRFIAFYESKGWMVGKNKMKDWKAAVRGWAIRDAPEPKKESKFAKYDRVDELVVDGVTVYAK